MHIVVNILTGWKNKSHCKEAGFENSEDIHLSEFRLKVTNGIRKVRRGLDNIDIESKFL